MMDTDGLESTEIPDYLEDVGGMGGEDESVIDVSERDEQFAVRYLFIRLADRCLSHAHAKVQFTEPLTSAEAPAPAGAAAAAAAPVADAATAMEAPAASSDSVFPPSDKHPLVIKKKSFPRIIAFVALVIADLSAF